MSKPKTEVFHGMQDVSDSILLSEEAVRKYVDWVRGPSGSKFLTSLGVQYEDLGEENMHVIDDVLYVVTDYGKEPHEKLVYEVGKVEEDGWDWTEGVQGWSEIQA